MTAAIRNAYVWVWAATATGALVAAVTGAAVQHADKPHPVLSATLATALSLWIANALVAMWPLALVRLGWHELPAGRLVGDALVAGHLTVQGLLVGGALGQQPELWRYLPHLPFEWLGIATPAAGWLLARHGHANRAQLRALATASLAVLGVAALVETWAVPL